MNLQIKPAPSCKQQQFTTAGLMKALSIKPERIGSFVTFASANKLMSGRGLDVEVAVSVLTQAMCGQLNVDVRAFGRPYSGFMNAAMLNLALDPSNWAFTTSEDDQPRSYLFSESEGVGLRRRRIQELLGIQERPVHRHLVLRPGQVWSVSDNISDRISGGEEPMVVMLDAVAVANKLSSCCSGPFFTWAP